MNSVISAFKTKKSTSTNSSNVAAVNDKHHYNGCGGGSKKKTINTQDNGYQYLRHIREIDTATKLLSPVVVAADDLLETDLLTFRPPQASHPLTVAPCADVVDHAMSVRLTPPSVDAIADCNMNGSKAITTFPIAATENGNCNETCCETSGFSPSSPVSNGQLSTTISPTQHFTEIEDDESEHSLAACTSSSSEHSNTTVLLSPTATNVTHIQHQQQQSQQPSPAKSLSLSLNSNSSMSSASSNSSSSASVAICNSDPSSYSSSTSFDVTTIAAPSPISNSTLSLITADAALAKSARSSPTEIITNDSVSSNASNSNATSDYVPAFLKSAPIILPIIMPNNSSGLASVPSYQCPNVSSTAVNSAATTPKHARYVKPRLSLSRFINHSMPSVHGRPNLSIAGLSVSGGSANDGSNRTNPPKRISTHQRNLSLDFRSMGILLPPVSQVTNTRINLTQHHRNRSLDSALQRIPEVEVSSPNAESDNTFCTPSILGSTMCSKIATTAANVTAALTTTTTPALTSSPPPPPTTADNRISPNTVGSLVTTKELFVTTIGPTSFSPSSLSTLPLASSTTVTNAVVNPSAIVEPCPTLRAGPKLSENNTTPATVGSSTNNTGFVNCAGSNSGNANNNCISSGSKKREDLTSLGSDDSGIICGSESDQISLNRICHSHESLDSGEMDAEEECIDMLETTSMDEEYGLIQSDLCFYQSTDVDCRTLRPSRKSRQNKVHNFNNIAGSSGGGDGAKDDDKLANCKNDSTLTDFECRIGYPDYKIPDSADIETPTIDVVDASSSTTASTPTTLVPISNATTPTASAPLKTPKHSDLSIETTKNDVLFKNFFGATKNAIFRTAQSIIENHEKKNAAKNNKSEDSSGGSTPQDQVKSPTEISKKKEFFSLITSNSSKKATERTLTLHLPATISSTTSNTSNISTGIVNSPSISSLHKLKVPGVVKCFIKDRPNITEAHQKTEKGPSGLLRFFESPVFNIHFAVHYLFYSKEPGVLSFIGNKIFSFPDQEVDLYMPQLIVMYIQMDELAEVLDPYLTIRCRKSVDFSLKCLWLLEAYNYQVDTLSTSGRKSQLSLMKEIFSKKERKILSKNEPTTPNTISSHTMGISAISPMIKKTHHRSQSDATVLLSGSRHYPSGGTVLSISNRLPYMAHILPATPAKLCLGDLTSGRAFENGCTCFESVRGQVNGLLGQKTVCSCGAPKTAPEKEFMKALINVGRNITSLPSKTEKTSALRMFLNLINKNLPARVWLPLYSDIPHHVVRITEEKTAVLNSKDKTPYIIYVEVVEVSDIYSSPLIPKMMPSLRHTKSEEHLEGVCSGQMHHASCSRTSSCSSGNVGNVSASSCKRKKEKLTSESSSVTSEVPSNIAVSNTLSGDACSCINAAISLSGLHITEDDVWSQEDDEITAQYLNLRKLSERDAISQMSLDSCDSRDQGVPVLFNIGDVRSRHYNNLNCENTKSFNNDPEDPSAAALKEPWHEKEQQIRESSPYGHLSNWRLLSAIVKCGDDLRQELMATQLLQMFKIIWQEENVDLWVRPYKIVCLSNDSGLIEPILNTVSLHQIKKNSNKSLRDYFIDEYGAANSERFRIAQGNFVQSCAAYCLISYLLQVKDRHNGNILLHSDGHIIHIDFGFILSISPKNLGFEQSPFKLTPEFVDVMGGTSSEHWKAFNRLLLVGMMSARKHMDRIINFVEIMRSNAQLPCFKNGCSGTVQNLRKRFHMNLTEQEMERKVEQLVQDSLKSLSTKLYDGYQYYTNGIL